MLTKVFKRIRHKLNDIVSFFVYVTVRARTFIRAIFFFLTIPWHRKSRASKTRNAFIALKRLLYIFPLQSCLAYCINVLIQNFRKINNHQSSKMPPPGFQSSAFDPMLLEMYWQPTLTDQVRVASNDQQCTHRTKECAIYSTLLIAVLCPHMLCAVSTGYHLKLNH